MKVITTLRVYSKMNLVLEFDDFNPKAEVDCIDAVVGLVSLYPKIKMTLFTSALYERTPLFSAPEWCDRVRKLIDDNNIRLAVHGLYHTVEEFKTKSKNDALLSIIIAESVFAVSNLPYIKVFRGPHWGINEATYEALIEMGYKSVFTHNDYKHLIEKYPQIKSVMYGWNIKDDDCTACDLVIGHGHTHNVCGNGIEESFDRICNFIDKNNPNFLFADEI